MRTIDAYVFFENECREAMTFYQQCLGGELQINPISGSPAADHIPPEKHDLIMHASLTHGDVVLLAADNCMGGPLIQGKRMSLMLNCSSEEEVHDLYAKLATGGQATHTPRVEFWGDVFGAC